jgi:hypothetical protein
VLLEEVVNQVQQELQVQGDHLDHRDSQVLLVVMGPLDEMVQLDEMAPLDLQAGLVHLVLLDSLDV